ncbi:MAG: GGDEF domain-containing protein [Caulobacteraceae bacterium]|nr:GGDEF domain-containing protein [Caulobacteraceae bacterium]MBX3428182.1 GGDEF domain-containing protein [Hyphomonadaceae bacterium]
MSLFDEAFDGPPGLALGHSAIDALGAQTLPTTPANYEIWVTHQLGRHPDLSRELQARIARGEPLSAAFLEDLFERYFANTRLSLQLIEAGESIARELTDVAATLKDAGSEAGAYSNALDTAASQFEQGIDPKTFRAVVTQLAVASRDMAARNKELAEQMAASSRQVDTLQAALQSVKVEALTDSLTGLANRKQFDAALRRRIEEANSGGSQLCLMMCDIDHFKRVNDTWGHLVGDQVIRFIANQMQQMAQGDCLCARYGGEEFTVIMPRKTLREASTFGEAFNRKVKAKVLTRRSTGESLGQVTVSIGIAQYRLGESVSDLIGRADACLYSAKRGGRDRVTTEEESNRTAA